MSNQILPTNQNLFEVMENGDDLMPATLEGRVILAFMTDQGGPNTLLAQSMIKSKDRVRSTLDKYNARLIQADPREMPYIARSLGLTEVPVLFFFERGNGQPRYALYGYFKDMVTQFEKAAGKTYSSKVKIRGSNKK